MAMVAMTVVVAHHPQWVMIPKRRGRSWKIKSRLFRRPAGGHNHISNHILHSRSRVIIFQDVMATIIIGTPQIQIIIPIIRKIII
jgi:hypothetical protein